MLLFQREGSRVLKKKKQKICMWQLCKVMCHFRLKLCGIGVKGRSCLLRVLGNGTEGHFLKHPMVKFILLLACTVLHIREQSLIFYYNSNFIHCMNSDFLIG